MEDNNTQTEEAPARRGRKSRERTRNNYAKALTELQARVDMTIRLLQKCVGSPAPEVIIEIAIKTLEGE